MATNQDKQYLKVSPTAYGVAFRRVLAEIEYAEDIYPALEKMKGAQTQEELDKLENMKMPQLTPFFEARYKLVNRLLADNHSDQILEVAAGLSPRGIAMTASNPILVYVELDLEGILEEKKQVHTELISQGKIKHTENHLLEAGDALDAESLLFATRHFKDKPIVVVNEGLMRYLSFDEKAKYAKNVAVLLKKFGGVWITPDLVFKKALNLAKARDKQLSKDLNINIDDNLFESEAHSRKFFEDLGFSIEVHPFHEIDSELISPKKLGTTPEQLADMLDLPVVYVMKLRQAP